jgi:hypothetical protein
VAKYMPIHFKNRQDRYSDQRVPKGKRLTHDDIVSYIGEPYSRIKLLSEDVMFTNNVFMEAKSLFNINEIATAIAGYNVYGPVLLAEKKEL